MDDRDATLRLGIRFGLAGLACGLLGIFSFFGVAGPLTLLAPILWLGMFVLGIAGIVASSVGLRARPRRAALGIGLGLAAILLLGTLLSIVGLLVLLALSHAG